jgi:hypothetical protein
MDSVGNSFKEDDYEDFNDSVLFQEKPKAFQFQNQ